MFKWYGYLGFALIMLSEINFAVRLQPFADWYLPIVWLGYILVTDSLVYGIRGRSLIASHPKEMLFIAIISVPFWLIFEAYNAYTMSWYYINYTWQVHIIDFATILPALMETFSLTNALGIGSRFDRRVPARQRSSSNLSVRAAVGALAAFGAFVSLFPFLYPRLGYFVMFFGLFLFLDPVNYLLGKPSVVRRVATYGWGMIPRLFISGLVMGFFWEFWNYQALPQWIYAIPVPFGFKLFEMPLWGYFGYLPFAMEAYVFVAFFVSFLFGKNELISM